MEALQQCLAKGKHRKTVPEWSSPLEVWQLLLCRGLRRFGRWRAAWLCNRSVPSWMHSPALEKLDFHLLCAARPAAKLPRLWNVSQTAQLAKMNNKKGCAAIRLVHLLDPVGKGFFKGLWDRHVFTNWDFAYGFSRGKRREAAIVHQRSLRHSLKKRGCSVHTGFFDVANAFPSPSHEALDSMLHATCPPNDVALLQSRYREALMCVTCAEGQRLVLAVGSFKIYTARGRRCSRAVR